MKVVLKGSKINLRQFVPSDAQDIYENINDRDIAKWLLGNTTVAVLGVRILTSGSGGLVPPMKASWQLFCPQ